MGATVVVVAAVEEYLFKFWRRESRPFALQGRRRDAARNFALRRGVDAIKISRFKDLERPFRANLITNFRAEAATTIFTETRRIRDFSAGAAEKYGWRWKRR